MPRTNYVSCKTVHVYCWPKWGHTPRLGSFIGSSGTNGTVDLVPLRNPLLPRVGWTAGSLGFEFEIGDWRWIGLKFDFAVGLVGLPARSHPDLYQIWTHLELVGLPARVRVNLKSNWLSKPVNIIWNRELGFEFSNLRSSWLDYRLGRDWIDIEIWAYNFEPTLELVGLPVRVRSELEVELIERMCVQNLESNPGSTWINIWSALELVGLPARVWSEFEVELNWTNMNSSKMDVSLDRELKWLNKTCYWNLNSNPVEHGIQNVVLELVGLPARGGSELEIKFETEQTWIQSGWMGDWIDVATDGDGSRLKCLGLALLFMLLRCSLFDV